jgi:hypothetical protein
MKSIDLDFVVKFLKENNIFICFQELLYDDQHLSLEEYVTYHSERPGIFIEVAFFGVRMGKKKFHFGQI